MKNHCETTKDHGKYRFVNLHMSIPYKLRCEMSSRHIEVQMFNFIWLFNFVQLYYMQSEELLKFLSLPV